VLRSVARTWLPGTVATKRKQGFSIPVDGWVDAAFKSRLRETLLESSSPLRDVFRPEAYRPFIESFCNGQPLDGVSRQGVYQRVIMLLALHLGLSEGATAGDRTSLTADLVTAGS
jgi:hypothetical protein